MARDKDQSSEDDVINANLKRVYDDILQQDVPDRFKDLLSQLKAQDPADENGADGGAV